MPHEHDMLCFDISIYLPLFSRVTDWHIDPSHKSHNVLDEYPTMNDFVTEMFLLQNSIWYWCIMGFVDRSIGQSYKGHTVYPKKYAHGFCFVVVIHWLIFPYPSGLLHWHCGNLTIAPVPAKQPWWIWINTSYEFIMNDCITTTKQSTTKPCAYFLGYTVGKTSHGKTSHYLNKTEQVTHYLNTTKQNKAWSTWIFLVIYCSLEMIHTASRNWEIIQLFSEVYL